MIKYYRVLRRFRKKVFLLGKHGTLIFNKSMPFLFVATVSSLFYLLCLKLGSIDLFQSLLSKMRFSLGSRVLLSRGLAREGWLLLVFILAAFGIFDVTIMKMTGGNETVNQGPHRGDAGPSSIKNSESDSGSWRKYLTLSSEIEVNQTPGRQAPPLPIESGTVPPANAVAFSEAGPSQVAPPAPSSTPSNSSTWSGPWIERWLYPEVSSSAPNEGGQPQGEEAASQPIGVMGPAVPSTDFLRKKIVLVLRSCARGYRRPRSDLLQRIEEDLRLETASPEKRLKIAQVLEELYTNRDFFVNSDQRPDYELTVAVADWERGL